MSESLRDDHARALTACLSDHFAAPVTIRDLRYMHGGGSRILARFTAEVSAAGGTSDHHLVFRLDPPSSFVESDRGLEFAALKALHGGPVPIPKPLLLDSTGAILGAPFFVMSEIAGGKASGFFDQDPYGKHAAFLGQQVFAALGRLAAVDIAACGLDQALPGVGANPAAAQLDHWERVLDDDETVPQPIVRSAIRALRRRLPPAPERLSVVHGDFRSGNFLFTPDGALLALLDWEFVHLGDPLEDLAWVADPLWGHGETERIGGMLPLDQAIAAWEAASGMTVDPDRLAWWRLFSAVKGIAMWTSSSFEFLRPGENSPVSAFPDTTCRPLQERVIAQTLWAWENGR